MLVSLSPFLYLVLGHEAVLPSCCAARIGVVDASDFQHNRQRCLLLKKMAGEEAVEGAFATRNSESYLCPVYLRLFSPFPAPPVFAGPILLGLLGVA